MKLENIIDKTIGVFIIIISPFVLLALGVVGVVFVIFQMVKGWVRSDG